MIGSGGVDVTRVPLNSESRRDHCVARKEDVSGREDLTSGLNVVLISRTMFVESDKGVSGGLRRKLRLLSIGSKNPALSTERLDAGEVGQCAETSMVRRVVVERAGGGTIAEIVGVGESFFPEERREFSVDEHGATALSGWRVYFSAAWRTWPS